MPECLLGITSKLYVNQIIAGGGTYAAPVWAECDLVSDVSVNGTWNEGESSVRRGRVQTFDPTNLALEVSGSIRKNINDDAFYELWQAWITGSMADVLVLDQARTVVDAEGVRFECHVFNFTEDQALQNVLFKQFTLKPSCAGNVPTQAQNVAGTLVYTAFGP